MSLPGSGSHQEGPSLYCTGFRNVFGGCVLPCQLHCCFLPGGLKDEDLWRGLGRAYKGVESVAAWERLSTGPHLQSWSMFRCSFSEHFSIYIFPHDMLSQKKRNMTGMQTVVLPLP